MAESWSERARRLDKKQEEERRRRRQREKLLRDLARTPGKAAKRAARKAVKDLTGPARRKLEREIRKKKYAAAKKAFGPCPTCGRANGPGHVCRMRFSERNAANLRRRMEKRGAEDYPDLWKGRRAA